MTEHERHTLLLRVAVLLYGPSWQTPLADALGFNLRTIQRWATGERLPSPETWARLAGLARDRHREIAAAIDEIIEASGEPRRTARSRQRDCRLP